MSKAEILGIAIGVAGLIGSIIIWILSSRDTKRLRKSQAVSLRLQEDSARQRGCFVQRDKNGEPTGGLDYHVTCNEKTEVTDSTKLKVTGTAKAEYMPVKNPNTRK